MKKLVTILLCLLLVSCTNRSRGNDASQMGAEYLNKMKEYETRVKVAPGERTDNPDFDKFLDKVFVEGMEGDFMTMHYSVVDYKAYGIEKPPVDLGQLQYGMDEENIKYMEDQLAELQSFDYDSLSYRQQYDYEALEYSLYETLASLAYYKYNFLFCSGSNLAENLVSNFTDYTFYDKESLDDYMTCLADVDRYFDDALAYTEAQSKDGYGPVDVWIDYTVDSCDGVLNKTEDNALIVTFNDRIDDLDFIDDAQKQSYKDENRRIVLEEVLPAYEKVKTEIEKYRGKKDLNDYALCNLDKNYAELTYMLQGSSNTPIDTIFEQLKQNFGEQELAYIKCYYSASASEKLEDAINGKVDSLNLVSRDCLEYLRTNLYKYYPDLGNVDYDVQELDPDTAPATAIAYYWPSPVDNYDQNIIRTNPNNMRAGYETYGTLSHEGFPGHLYQHVFYYKTNPHNFRSVIGFIGYTEGWAVNAQKYAYKFAGIDDDAAATALYFEDAYYFPLYSIIDIGVNYYGWTAKDIVKYFEDSMLFEFSEEDAGFFRDFLIEMPGVYCSYGIGSNNFVTLESYAKSALGDKFDYVQYHEALLKNGPLPFNILQCAVDEYIENNK